MRARRSGEALGGALVAAAACGWGTWPFFLRRAEAVGPVHPALESAFALCVVTLASAPVCLFDRVRGRKSIRQWAAIVWLGVADALNVVCFFAAYQRTSVAVAVLTHYLTPLFVAILAPLVLREAPARRVLASIGLSFGGLVLLLAPFGAERHAGDGAGAALGAASAVFYASNVLVNQRLVGAFSGAEMAFYHGLVATAFLLVLVPAGAWSGLARESIVVLAVGSILVGALGGLFFVWGLRRIDAARASNLTFLEPLVAVSGAWFFLGEELTIGRLAGGALILSAAALVIVDLARGN
jgi:drug/metabolite transporter (DMT)-like permease